jgi:hypothetical protein
MGGQFGRQVKPRGHGQAIAGRRSHAPLSIEVVADPEPGRYDFKLIS